MISGNGLFIFPLVALIVGIAMVRGCSSQDYILLGWYLIVTGVPGSILTIFVDFFPEKAGRFFFTDDKGDKGGGEKVLEELEDTLRFPY